MGPTTPRWKEKNHSCIGYRTSQNAGLKTPSHAIPTLTPLASLQMISLKLYTHVHTPLGLIAPKARHFNRQVGDSANRPQPNQAVANLLAHDPFVQWHHDEKHQKRHQ